LARPRRLGDRADLTAWELDPTDGGVHVGGGESGGGGGLGEGDALEPGGGAGAVGMVEGPEGKE
jgi:hypothetical protein